METATGILYQPENPSIQSRFAVLSNHSGFTATAGYMCCFECTVLRFISTSVIS